MAIKEYNVDLDVKGRVLATTVPNSTGSIVTWNSSTNVFGLRTNAQIISDLNLSSNFVTTNTNQTGLSGTKTWTGYHTFSRGGTPVIKIERDNSSGNALIQYSTTSSDIYAGQSSSGTFAIGNLNNLISSNFFNISETSVGIKALSGVGDRIVTANSTGVLSATTVLPNFDNFVTTNTSQTGIGGDKEWLGIQTYRSEQIIETGSGINNYFKPTYIKKDRSLYGGNYAHSIIVRDVASWGSQVARTGAVVLKIPPVLFNNPYSIEIHGTLISNDKPVTDFKLKIDNRGFLGYSTDRGLTDVFPIIRMMRINSNENWGLVFGDVDGSIPVYTRIVIDKMIYGRIETNYANIPTSPEFFLTNDLTGYTGVSTLSNLTILSTPELHPNRALLGSSANSVLVLDTRNSNPLPTTDLQQGVWFDFKEMSTIGTGTGSTTYGASMTFVPFHNDSGNNFSAFRLTQSSSSNSNIPQLFVQKYRNGAWYDQYRIWHEGNLSQSSIDNWNTAFGWGNHALVGYLTSTDLNGYATETWVTQQINDISIPTVNDGQLSIGTGTGLSGSVNFTANQAGNSSVTIDVASTHKLPTITEWDALPTTNTITRLRGTASGTFTSGDLTLLAGTGIGITQSGSNITITNSSPNIVQTLSQTGQVVTLSNGGGSFTLPTPNAGTVTSVAMSTPTGLTVTGSPITTSGTLALTYATGYQGYTTAEANKLSGLNNYILPTASATVLGGIKVGSNLSIDANGVLSATNTNTTYTAGTGLSLTGTVFGQTITTSGTGTFVTGVTQTANGFQVNLGTPPNTTYTTDTLTILNTGTSTTGALQSSKNLNDWLNGKGYATQTWVTSQGFSTQTLTAGTNINIVGNVISAVDTNTTYSAGAGLTLSGTTFSLPVTYAGTGNYVSDVTQTTNGLTVTKSNLPTFTDAITSISRNGVNIPIVSQNVDIPVFSTSGAGLVPARVGSVATKYLREDGTWVTPTNTTYTNMAIAELNTGTVTTARTISASVLNQWLNVKGFSTQTLVAGSNITISPTNVISATDTNTITRIGVDFGNYSSGDINFTATGGATIAKNGQNINIHVEHIEDTITMPAGYPDVPPFGPDLYWKYHLRNCIFEWEQWRNQADPGYSAPNIGSEDRRDGDNLYVTAPIGQEIQLEYVYKNGGAVETSYTMKGDRAHFIFVGELGTWLLISETTTPPPENEFIHMTVSTVIEASMTNKYIQTNSQSGSFIELEDGLFDGQFIDFSLNGIPLVTIEGNLTDAGLYTLDIEISTSRPKVRFIWNTGDYTWWAM